MDNESSSSNPLPNPNEESPRRYRGGQTVSRVRQSWEPALFAPPLPPLPPVMGVPGVSAFRPYRPPPPPPPPPQPAPTRGPSGSRGLGLGGGGLSLGLGIGGGSLGLALAVGGSGSGGGASSGALRIGGSPFGRKRGREAAAPGAAGDGGGGDVRHYCSVCNKGFGSSKALFGHMRSHPDRGWKGVHPPPAFRAEEEFADLRAGEDGGAAEEGEGEVGEGSGYHVPDLNHPPPPDAK